MFAMIQEEQVRIGSLALPGELSIPPRAATLVAFVHGGASSGTDPNDRCIALALQRHGIATLLFNLVSDAEASSRHDPFEPALLCWRVVQVLGWVADHPRTRDLRVGLFGSRRGAAVALMAAAERPGQVLALVSCGGRLDSADDCLSRIEAPTLLIVGSGDPQVEFNRIAFRRLRCIRRLEVLPRATHRLEEPGALESVAELATTWFDVHLHNPRTT
jgi:pimeloyl-ACP methyl ester carboxylesterase